MLTRQLTTAEMDVIYSLIYSVDGYRTKPHDEFIFMGFHAGDAERWERRGERRLKSFTGSVVVTVKTQTPESPSDQEEPVGWQAGPMPEGGK